MGKLSNLPIDILLEILSRLPTETVLECKLVCKPWKNLVSHSPSFSHMHLTHLNHHQGKMTFLTLDYQMNHDHQQFRYFEYNEDEEKGRITRFNINPPFQGYRLIGSCNGLICISAYDKRLYDYEPSCICNPVTKEYVILPKFKRVRNRDDYNLCAGFGYLRETNEYKVVRIEQVRGRPKLECFEVYTLGSGNGWRNVRESGLSFSVDCFGYNHGVFVNETLYWITVNGKIVSFNLAHEKFCEIPILHSPPSLTNNFYRHYKIGVLGGFLGCSFTQHTTGRTDIWLLKKNGNQNMMEQKEDLSFTWGTEYLGKTPLAFIKSGKVLISSSSQLYSHDIKSSCLKTLINFPQPVCQAIPHMNTLISLKALGEESTKTME